MQSFIRSLHLWPSFLTLVLSLLVAGCAEGFSGSGQSAPERQSTTTAVIGPQGELQILSPISDTTVPAGDVEVRVRVVGFTLVDKMGQSAVAGEGHLHYYLDVERLTQHPTTPDLMTPAMTSDTSWVFQGVESGEHRFSVQLVDNDHSALDPPVITTVLVTAR